jgi:hemerythrin HHE cation binding domain-containing protein
MIAQDTAAWPIPSSLNNEHSRLHIELEAAAKAPGRIGVAARAVAAALHPHFVREEAIALPPLALLGALARGELTPDMRAILPLTDALERELPTMLEEHQAIHRALDELTRASREAGVAEYAELSDKIRLHALSEEQILYPAAVLVGKYMKCRLG